MIELYGRQQGYNFIKDTDKIRGHGIMVAAEGFIATALTL